MGVQTNENQRGEGGNKDKMQRNNNNNNNNNQRYQQRERRDSGRNEQENRGDMNRGGYRVSHADFLSQNPSKQLLFFSKIKTNVCSLSSLKRVAVCRVLNKWDQVVHRIRIRIVDIKEEVEECAHLKM